MQRSVILALSAVALGALAPLACTQNFGQFDATAGGTSGAGSSVGGASGASTSVGGTPTGSSSTSGSGSGGGSASCTESQCADDNPCTTDRCNLDTGACVHDKLDGPQPAVDDGNSCTTDLCVDGAPTHENVPANTACGTGKFKCDGNGNCVGCTSASQCPVNLDCKVGTCTNSQCGVANAPQGTPCSAGKCTAAGACVECLSNPDCNGGICQNNQCVDGCSDSTQNGEETDVDCGGPTCSPCETGKKCVDDADCVKAPCLGGICNPCENGIKDGQETDLDCGGGQCPKCAVGSSCEGNTDCLSNSCKNKVCAP